MSYLLVTCVFEASALIYQLTASWLLSDPLSDPAWSPSDRRHRHPGDEPLLAVGCACGATGGSAGPEMGTGWKTLLEM